jgi:hypothetical protein
MFCVRIFVNRATLPEVCMHVESWDTFISVEIPLHNWSLRTLKNFNLTFAISLNVYEYVNKVCTVHVTLTVSNYLRNICTNMYTVP